ncbi:MAG: PsiF family protein, partial [Bdellovibrionota bacterium]
MKPLFAAAIVLGFFCSPAFAGPQQEKMKTCNAEATGKKGEERKAFMKDCLSAKAAAPVKTEDHKQRMRDCN